jgi:hypothetical protein
VNPVVYIKVFRNAAKVFYRLPAALQGCHIEDPVQKDAEEFQQWPGKKPTH